MFRLVQPRTNAADEPQQRVLIGFIKSESLNLLSRSLVTLLYTIKVHGAGRETASEVNNATCC